MNKRILLGITGSIAAYKTPELIRKLKEQSYDVRVILTSCGKAFVTPLTLQAVSQHKIYEGLIDVEAEAAMSHIELARWPDCILIAPATAHIIAKLAHGFADDLLSTLCLASNARIIIVPAMNQAMWFNQATQDNINLLKERNCLFIGPGDGVQACGDVGLGRMLEPIEIVDALSKVFVKPYLHDQRILITAGPTQECIDPVRYLSNRSSGKMGFALAQAAVEAGAEVTLISGPVALTTPKKLKFIAVKTANEMLSAVEQEISQQTVFISTAAVADYQIVNPALQKIKKSNAPLTLQLKPTIDILATVSQMSFEARPLLVGFSAETEYTLQFAEEKRRSKNVDLMVVNDVSQTDIGFDSDKNEVTVLSSDVPIHLACASKHLIARQLLQIIANRTHNTEKC
ncbi:MAG: phosphopantothenoylcysteine decarboxylase/phosphopantothenate--cysteine ligase [Pseudomonadota bacterium]|jgi:phosphopantothenoylcysteine decarboxylase / phosphopantothenate---cysteine ligase